VIARERDPDSHRVILVAAPASIRPELADQAKERLRLRHRAGGTLFDGAVYRTIAPAGRMTVAAPFLNARKRPLMAARWPGKNAPVSSAPAWRPHMSGRAWIIAPRAPGLLSSPSGAAAHCRRHQQRTTLGPSGHEPAV